MIVMIKFSNLIIICMCFFVIFKSRDRFVVKSVCEKEVFMNFVKFFIFE